MTLHAHSEPKEKVTDLAGEIAKDATKLIKDEVRLLKVSVAEGFERAAKSLLLYVSAAIVGLLGLVWLSFGLSGGLTALGLAPWASQLAVAFLFFAASAGAALFANFQHSPSSD